MPHYIPKQKRIEAVQFTGQEEVFGCKVFQDIDYYIFLGNFTIVFDLNCYIIKDTYEILTKEEFEERYGEVEDEEI